MFLKLSSAVFVLGLLVVGYASWIPLKAELAQVLLKQAWADTLVDAQIHRPWSWADHWPVARLSLFEKDIDLIVLEGDSGSVLAFAPGHAVASGMPDERRSVVISGHRDTHFKFLEDVSVGEIFQLETIQGQFSYQVKNVKIRDSRVDLIDVRQDVDELILVTCYPFNAPVAGGPLRYVAQLVRVD